VQETTSPEIQGYQSARPIGAFFLLRYAIALTLTATLVVTLLNAFVFVSIRGMPQKKTLLLLGLGVVAVVIVNWRLFRHVRHGRQLAAMFLLAAVWVATSATVGHRQIDENGGDPAILGMWFGISTLAFPFAVWFFAWSVSRPVYLGFTVLLAGFLALGHQMLRIDGLAGDETKVAMSWRRAPSATEPIKATDVPAQLQVFNEYPQFLGPNRDAIIPNVKLDTDWNAHPPTLLWRQPIGAGLGGFVIQDGKAITLEQKGEQEAITCYRLETGESIWQVTHPGHFSHGLAKSGPRSTPAIDNGQVFAIGALGTFSCIDLESGKVLWTVETSADPANNLAYGIASSPLVDGDKVYVCQASPEGKCLAAFDRKSGKRLWEGGDAVAGYSSPILATLAGKRQLVLFNSANLIGLDPDNGALLWSFPWSNDPKNNCSQPIPHAGKPDQVFVSTGYSTGAALVTITAKTDQTFEVKPVWESRSMRNKFSTSVIIDDVVYGLDEGILAAVDLSKGKRLWKKDRIGHGQLLLVGGTLLAMSENGDLQLLEVTRAGSKQLALLKNAVDGKTWNYPALAAPYLLLRNDHEACCYKLNCAPLPSGEETPVADKQD
jgi:outer membrane protein assembly factor BamB